MVTPPPAHDAAAIAIAKIKRAIMIASTDTLSIASGGGQTVWHATGSYGQSERISLADMRVLLSLAVRASLAQSKGEE